MSEAWIYFPMGVDRPEGAHKYTVEERDLLEIIIARQVTDLLSLHGDVTEAEVDNSGVVATESYKTFITIELDPFILDNDSQLQIGQLPYTAEGFLCDRGAHSVVLTDDEGDPCDILTVWDPEFDKLHHVQDGAGNPVELGYLQELTEALIIAAGWIRAMGEAPNNPPLATSEYPVQVIEPALQALEFDL